MKTLTKPQRLPRLAANIFGGGTTVLLTVLLTLLAQSCSDCDVRPPTCKFPELRSSEMFMRWNLQIQKTYTYRVGLQMPVPLVTRLVAIYHAAMHDALNSVVPVYQIYASPTINPSADPDATMVQAVYDALVAVGPQAGPARVSIDSLYQVSMASIPAGAGKEAGIVLGKTVAAAVLAKRQPDAPYLLVTGFNPTPASGTEPGQYKYLPPLNYALAGFHLMTPWIATRGDQFRVGPPNSVNSNAYTTDYNEVKAMGELNSTSRTDDQRALAIFWAEASSYSWNTIAREVLKNSGRKLDAWEAARLFAVLHMGIADSYISIFDSKFYYNTWRPITAVREGDKDGNPNTVGNAAWEPLLVTPAMGGYPSANAWSGAVAGKILMRFFDRDAIRFTIDSGRFPGLRSFNKISDAVRECGISRIYVGYQFRKGVTVGEARGYEMGDFLFKNSFKKNKVPACVDR